MRHVHALSLVIALASCHRLPEWEGDIVAHPAERAAVRQCGTGELTAAGTQHITREPYLQATTTTSTTVAFGSQLATVEVTLRAATGEHRIARLAREASHGTRSAGEVRVLYARFDGLEPNQLYCYQLVHAGTPLTEPAPLSTASGPGSTTPVRFVVLGDSGTGGPAQRALGKRMSEVGFDLMLLLGDIAYDSGTPRELQQRFFDVYSDVLRYVPAYPVIGNHERRTQTGRPFFDAFVLPPPERYYSFDWGDIHFVAIDTTYRDGAQLAWLARDLASTQQRWKIVFGHHPLYTNGLRGPQRGIRTAYGKIFQDHGVDVVIAGHEHHYERFRVDDINYIVSGGGGARLTRFYGSTPSLQRAASHHFLHFEVTADELVMRAITIDGREIETLRLTKQSARATPKANVDGVPEPQQSPIAPEQTTVPDETLHDEADP